MLDIYNKKIYELYPPGSAIWYCASNKRQAWRAGTVVGMKDAGTQMNNPWLGSITVKWEGNNKLGFISGYDKSKIIPRAFLPHNVPGTVYAVDTFLGSSFAKRLGERSHFEVFELATRYATPGKLLGYVILPCFLQESCIYYEQPDFKTWVLQPNVYELLGFLGSKLPEVISLYRHLYLSDQKTNTEALNAQKGATILNQLTAD